MLVGALHSFLSTIDAQSLLVAALNDRRLAHLDVRSLGGGASAAEEFYQGSDTPELLVIELPPTDTVSEAADRLTRLAENCDPGTAVLLMGWVNDIDWYRRLMDLGIAEYLCLPAPSSRLSHVLIAALQRDDAAGNGKVTAVLGASGGAGASTVALELAYARRRKQQPAPLLMDLDWTFGSQDLLTDVPARDTIKPYLLETPELDPALLAKLLHSAQGLRIFAGVPSLKTTEPLLAPDGVRRLLTAARFLASDIILDLPHAWTPAVREALRFADEVVLVALPTVPGFRNLRTLITACEALRPNEAPPRVLVNRVPSDFARSEFGRSYVGGLAAGAYVLAGDCGLALASAQARLGRVSPKAALAKALAQLFATGKAPEVSADPKLWQRLPLLRRFAT